MCSICYSNPCPAGCPNYEPPEAIENCVNCGSGIYEGDKCIETSGGGLLCETCYEEIPRSELFKVLDLQIIKMRN